MSRESDDKKAMTIVYTQKVADATEVDHQVRFGVIINLWQLGIRDAFAQAELVMNVGSIGPDRCTVRLKNNNMFVGFEAAGLDQMNTLHEVEQTFGKIKQHVVAMAVELQLDKDKLNARPGG